MHVRYIQELGWEPKWTVRQGLLKTIEYFEEELKKHASSDKDTSL